MQIEVSRREGVCAYSYACSKRTWAPIGKLSTFVPKICGFTVDKEVK